MTNELRSRILFLAVTTGLSLPLVAADEKPRPTGAGTGAAPAAAAPFPITEMNRDGAKELRPDPSAAWAAPSFAPAPVRIPGNLQPMNLPKLDISVRWKDVDIRGTRAFFVVKGEGYARRDNKSSGVVRGDILGGPSVVYEINPESTGRDISPNGSQLVAQSDWDKTDQSQRRLDLYKLAAKATHVKSFLPGEVIYDACFADEQHVLTLITDEIACWDIAAGTMKWKMSTAEPTKVTGGTAIARSPDGKHFAVSTAAGVTIFEPLEGKIVGVLPGEDVGTPAFSVDGQIMAARQNGILHLWNLKDGKLIDKIKFRSVPGKARDLLEGKLIPLNKEFVLVGEQLLSIPKRAFVYRYTGSPAMATAGSRVFAVVRESARTVLASAELPHAAARKAIEKAPAAEMDIGPGQLITLDINPETTDEKKLAIIQALTKKLEAAGLKIAEGQPLRLSTRTLVTKTEQREFGAAGVGGVPGNQTITISTRTTFLTLQRDGRTLWEAQRSANNDPGDRIRLQEGETLQGYADERAKTIPVDWMLDARFPTTIVTAADPTTLPESIWTLGGVKEKQ